MNSAKMNLVKIAINVISDFLEGDQSVIKIDSQTHLITKNVFVNIYLDEGEKITISGEWVIETQIDKVKEFIRAEIDLKVSQRRMK